MTDWPLELRRGAALVRRAAADWLTGRRRLLVPPRGHARQSAEAPSDTRLTALSRAQAQSLAAQTSLVRPATIRLTALSRAQPPAPPATDGHPSAFPVRVSVTQAILPTEHVAAKIHNLALARRLIDDLPIPRGGILSFWRLIGRPTAARGFQAGRSLLGGKLRPDFGGGLCQLSGALYYVSLIGGLRIIERHAHSRDIYTEATRFAPLGADATVAYGLKDLRIQNTLSQPVCFRLELAADHLTGSLCAPQAVAPCRVEFVPLEPTAAGTGVQTRRWLPGRASPELVAVSWYAAPAGS